MTALLTCPTGLLEARLKTVTMRVKCNKIHMTTAPVDTATPGHLYWCQAPATKAITPMGISILEKFMAGS